MQILYFSVTHTSPSPLFILQAPPPFTSSYIVIIYWNPLPLSYIVIIHHTPPPLFVINSHNFLNPPPLAYDVICEQPLTVLTFTIHIFIFSLHLFALSNTFIKLHRGCTFFGQLASKATSHPVNYSRLKSLQNIFQIRLVLHGL